MKSTNLIGFSVLFALSLLPSPLYRWLLHLCLYLTIWSFWLKVLICFKNNLKLTLSLLQSSQQQWTKDIFIPREIISTEVAHMVAQMAPFFLAILVVNHFGIIDLAVLLSHAAKSTKQRATLLVDVRTDIIMWNHQHTLLKPFRAPPQIGTLTLVPLLTWH